MKIKELKLHQFRSFDHMVMQFDDRLTVLVGVNGAGKTSIINALTILLSHFNRKMLDFKRLAPKFSESDIRVGSQETVNSVTVAHNGKTASWTIEAYRKGAKTHPKFHLAELTDFVNALGAEDLTSLPLAVCYGVNRAVQDISLSPQKAYDFDNFSAYGNALSERSYVFNDFFEWCRVREDIENEYRLHAVEQNESENQNLLYRDPQLEAVRQAIYRMTGFSNMRIRRNPPRMEVRKGEQRLDVAQLSDGEKCLLALVGDIARRLALANLKLDDPLQTTAVVMIDEAELHLHPEWQHRIVPGLIETFPNCQFILSTHSPQVLSHVRCRHIRCLDQKEDRVEVTIPDGVYGQDSNFLLKTLLGSSYRPKNIEADIQRLFDLIRADVTAARKLLDELKQRIEGESPDLVRAEALLHRREVLAS